MDAEEARVEHLKLLQAIIDRMARNSFSIKAGSLALSTGLLAFSVGIHSWQVFFVVIPLLALWVLDAYFIRQERLFRQLYDVARIGPAPEIGTQAYFSMNVNSKHFAGDSIWATATSKTLFVFHLPLLLLILLVIVINSIL